MKPPSPGRSAGRLANAPRAVTARIVALLLLLAVPPGCTGTLVDPDEVIEPGAPGESAAAPPSALRRLTHTQFLTMAAQLFGTDAPLEQPEFREALVAEVSTDGLRNDADAQVLTPVMMAGYVAVARAIAEEVVAPISTGADLRALTGCHQGTALKDCSEDYVLARAELAFRRPLAADDKAALRDMLDAVDARLIDEGIIAVAATQLRAGIVAILTSPDFLLVLERGAVPVPTSAGRAPLSDYEIATRLSLLVGPGLPDAVLLELADAGALADPDERVRQLDRLLADERVREHLVELVLHWLEIDLDHATLGSETAGGAFQGLVKAAAMAQLTELVHDWIANDRPFRDLYATPIPLQTRAGDTVERAVGILGMPALVASHTHVGTPAPITRGNFALTRLLCRPLPSPPADIPEPSSLDDGPSQRDWLENHAQEACRGCHELIDNYGFPFENIDTAGFFVASGTGAPPVDPSATLPRVGDVEGEVANLEDFASQIASSDTAHRCMTEFWFRHAYGRQVTGADRDRIDALAAVWRSDDGSVFGLLRAIVASDDFSTLYTQGR